MYIGCHLSVSDGYEAMGKTALSIGANTFQFFTRNPRSSRFKAPSIEDVNGLNKIIKDNNFGPVLAHAPYTFNPASVKDDLHQYTVDAMKEDISVMDMIPNSLYNFHPGCHVGEGADVGINQTASVLNEVISENQSTIILIETMAGKGTEIGKTFEEIAEIISKTNENLRPKVGVCLDTCHVWDGGYNIAENTSDVIDKFDEIIGLDRLKAIHINDTKNPFEAHKDRHEKIGEGFIGIEGFKAIINEPRLKMLPFYLETPNELDGYAKEIELLKSLSL